MLDAGVIWCRIQLVSLHAVMIQGAILQVVMDDITKRQGDASNFYRKQRKESFMIHENVRKIRKELPEDVELVAAAKGRTADEIQAVVDSGISIIGENYVTEAKSAYQQLDGLDIGDHIEWHFIGVLKKAKHDILRRKNLNMFDMIQTVDSFEIAEEISERCARIKKTMPVLIEINSGREPQKAGVLPEQAETLIWAIAGLSNVWVRGLMTMGPRFGNPENSRPYFIETREVFNRIKSLDLPNVEMKYLSMGMTNSYQVAIEEGANMVRIGTKIFGEREECTG